MISCNLPAIAGLVKRIKSRRSQAVRHVEAGNDAKFSGSSGRTPPKTPTLKTWREDSAVTLGKELSEDEFDETIMLPARTVAPG